VVHHRHVMLLTEGWSVVYVHAGYTVSGPHFRSYALDNPELCP